MNFFKEYLLPALTLLLIALILVFAVHFIAQTSWAESVRTTAAAQTSGISDAPLTFTSLLRGLGFSIIKLTLLIGVTFTITWNSLKRANKRRDATASRKE